MKHDSTELCPAELPLHGKAPLQIALRALRPSEQIAALAWARAHARKHGVDKPDDDEPIYARALMAAVLARACVRPDSDPAAPAPVFTDADEILDHADFTEDHLAYLYELYEVWRDEVSPMAKTVGADKVLAHARECVEARDASPFVRLRPGLRWILHRSMAAALLTFATSTSPAGGGSPSTASSSTARGKKSIASHGDP